MNMPTGLVIHPSSVPKDLGVTLDSHLIMDAHVDKMVNVCIYQMHQLRPLRNRDLLIRPPYWFMPLL